MAVPLKVNSAFGTAFFFAVFFAIPIALGTVVNYKGIGGYLSPLILLALTWLLYKRKGSDLSELGLDLRKRHMLFLPLGIILGVILITIALAAQLAGLNAKLEWNGHVNFLGVFGGIFFILQGVLNEELIFRGYCFKDTIDRIGLLKANLLFAFLFMVWHWISWNAWGNYPMMFSSITTGIGHILFATALVSSRTLFFPIGMHLGINWAQKNIFTIISPGNIADKQRSDVLFFVSSVEQELSPWHNLLNILLPVILFLALAWLMWRFRFRDI